MTQLNDKLQKCDR